MLSGLKFIPRDKIEAAEQDENLDDSRREGKKSGSRKEKDGSRKKKSFHSSSDDEGLEKIKKRSKRKTKWYSSDEDSLHSSDVSGTGSGSDYNEKGHRSRRREKKRDGDGSHNEGRSRSKKKRQSRRKNYSSEDRSSYDSESDGDDDRAGRRSKKKGRMKDKKRRSKKDFTEEGLHDEDGRSDSHNIARKEMGLDWMLKPKSTVGREAEITSDCLTDEPPADEEMKRANPRELNPYLKDNGSGYPEDADTAKAAGHQLISSSVVGDGGASWRLKALKRAQEQAAREGKKLDEVVGERWGSLGQLTVSVASTRAAPSRAHLHAIRNRQKGLGEEQHTENDRVTEKNIGRERSRDTSTRPPQMRVPKFHDSLSWGKQRSKNLSNQDAAVISSAMSSMNRFSNDGSFMQEVMSKQNIQDYQEKCKKDFETELVKQESERHQEDSGSTKQALSANQLAAKALQLRLKGKHEEADKLLKEAESIGVKERAVAESSRLQNIGTTSRYVMHNMSIRQKNKEEDADIHLAQTIVQNQRYSISGRADDEYNYDEGPRKKTRKKGGTNDGKAQQMASITNRVLTQQERCQFCFENPKRPKHLVVAIANITYLTLPPWQPVVPGHCCILPMQHESATRSVDNNVWEEIRNFKKCLIMMFGKQEKDVVFLETVLGLAQQRRHCLVECIPLPREVSKQAPLYFKKAIDEAEDEWSQHNAKKLIDTSEKGLRASIPKDFPYFHVEFGLDKGFVHVIDDENNFSTNFGQNVVRGMLRLPEEDMYGRRKHDSVERQNQSVASFVKDWEPFDWTKQL